jgi:sortase A
MTRNDVLRWLERGLLAAGVGLGAWCAAVLVEARFHDAVAMRDAGQLVVTQTAVPALPGDAGDARTRSRPAPAAGTLLGRIEAPTVRMSASLLEGSDDATLRRGAGHIEDTPLPGEAGNIGIAGHRDTVFRPLRHIKVGDPLTLVAGGQTYRYTISKTLIVGPDDVYVLDPTAAPTLTLVTCYPFEFIGHAPKRFIVQASLVDGQRGTIGTDGTDGRNTVKKRRQP